jgi:Pyruvate/2-oxoacid:ferredoxin oxidoreductase delta subunit
MAGTAEVHAMPDSPPSAVYGDLARRLDAIPNGFPPAPSGVELRLLARLFTPQEAALAVVMLPEAEPAEVIAERAGVAPAVAEERLRRMAVSGLIWSRPTDAGTAYGLMPFVVGVYEAQLPRLDAGLAELFELYFRETRGIVVGAPPVHRVIPVEQAVRVGLEVLPFESASQLLAGAKSWAVRACICRTQQRLVGRGCDRPVDNCLSFAPVESAFQADGVSRPIALDEALRILYEAEEAGLVHTVTNARAGLSYICNCCTCCCGILRSVVEFDLPGAVARAAFRAAVDRDACVGCGKCAGRCAFEAVRVEKGKSVVDAQRCVGCGQCCATCPSDAIHLERRPAGDAPPIPDTESDWLAQRAAWRARAETE